MRVSRSGIRLLLLVAVCLLSLPRLLVAADSQVSEPGPVSLSGRFAIVWGDPEWMASESAAIGYRLFGASPGREDGAGYAIALAIDPQALALPGGLLGFNRQLVTVQGHWLGDPGPGTAFRVEAIQPVQQGPGHEISGVYGSQPWVSVMCKFNDIPDEPKDLGYFQGMYAPTYPGLDHYWRQASFDKIDLLGSMAVGWYTLPHPRSYYVYDSDGDGDEDLDWGRAAEDCTAVADADVYYPDFVGINLMFNANLDCCAWGGSWWLNRDGQWKLYRMTWEPPWGYGNVGVIAHETGHGFGLPHSSGDYGQVYDNRWDVMSDLWTDCGSLTDPTYGCLGQGTICFHLDLLEWVEDGQSVVVEPGSRMTIALERLQLPTAGDALIAVIPIDGSPNWFYTVEARQRVGYDVKLPAQGVIVHEVETGRPEPAHVVDIDGDGNTGDAYFLPGQSFADEAHDIVVNVDAVTDTGYTVTIANQYLLPVHVHGIQMRYLEKNGRYLVMAGVRIVDVDGQVVPGAGVSAEWTLPDGQMQVAEAQTGNNGVAPFRIRSLQAGEHTLCVTDVTKEGAVYDADGNRITCRTIVVGP